MTWCPPAQVLLGSTQVLLEVNTQTPGIRWGRVSERGKGKEFLIMVERVSKLCITTYRHPTFPSAWETKGELTFGCRAELLGMFLIDWGNPYMELWMLWPFLSKPSSHFMHGMDLASISALILLLASISGNDSVPGLQRYPGELHCCICMAFWLGMYVLQCHQPWWGAVAILPYYSLFSLVQTQILRFWHLHTLPQWRTRDLR